ncbi:MAG TPA: alkaline phosphatase family protein [Pyrinomonadaceae bacterium]|nr:alkaline phosphatase family protein [Pyrinomonadaceae bacterium]
MSQDSDSRVIAIVIDAATPQLVRRMIDHDELPVLKSLLSAGEWKKVSAPANIGSGAVWPTFITGTDPRFHGIHGEWRWHPSDMSLSRYRGRDLTPFWQTLADNGTTIGILDLPFMPMIGLENGFEISEWAPHDVLEGHIQVAPEKIRTLVSNSPPHALSSDRLKTEGPKDLEGLQRLNSACLEGIKVRGKLAQALLQETNPRLAIIAFTEIHRTGHFIWHNVEPENEVYARDEFANLPALKPDLKDLLREVDRQIGSLIDTCAKDATVIVFSLHGMRPAYGASAFLAPLLIEMGFARLADWRGQSWRERALTLMAAVKRHSPDMLKKLYYKSLPQTTTHRLARPTMLPAYDWNQTRAFSLPTDQHGWVRINLRGREAAGIVAAENYDEICREIETKLRALTTNEGKPLVQDVLRTSVTAEDAIASSVPDLVVHWTNAVFESPLGIKGSLVKTPPVGTYTGQHAGDGFCIFKGNSQSGLPDVLLAQDLGALISRSLS